MKYILRACYCEEILVKTPWHSFRPLLFIAFVSQGEEDHLHRTEVAGPSHWNFATFQKFLNFWDIFPLKPSYQIDAWPTIYKCNAGLFSIRAQGIRNISLLAIIVPQIAGSYRGSYSPDSWKLKGFLLLKDWVADPRNRCRCHLVSPHLSPCMISILALLLAAPLSSWSPFWPALGCPCRLLSLHPPDSWKLYAFLLLNDWVADSQNRQIVVMPLPPFLPLSPFICLPSRSPFRLLFSCLPSRSPF